MLKTLPVDIQLHLMQFLSARDIAAVGEVSPGEWLYFKLRFLMMSDFLRQTSLRPDEIAAQTLLEDKVKDRMSISDFFMHLGISGNTGNHRFFP